MIDIENEVPEEKQQETDREVENAEGDQKAGIRTAKIEIRKSRIKKIKKKMIEKVNRRLFLVVKIKTMYELYYINKISVHNFFLSVKLVANTLSTQNSASYLI